MKNRENIMQKYGITESSLMQLKKFNLIIGKNGAGKTRLLKALKEEFKTQNATVIYAYFPEMHANYIEKPSENEYEIPLYEIIFEGENIEFNNFVKYIEQHGYDFLNELLRDLDGYVNYKKSVRRSRAKTIQDDLNEILKILINRRLIFDSEIYVESYTYNTKRKLIEDLKTMSPGELMLFYLSILLIIIKHNKDQSQKIIVLLDEPELHLHPKALIKFVDYLKQEDSIGTCCIATHSIFLVPLCDFYEIIYIENGEIQRYNSQLYSNVVKDIIGENRQLTDFLQSIDMWKYYQFIAECFCLPSSVSVMNPNDEQLLKFLTYIRTSDTNRKEISVLDFGAGEGRLGKALINTQKNSKTAISKIRYYYYDKYQKKPLDLECKSFEKLEEIHNKRKKFNCVVLMNVLHEIDVQEWRKTFHEIYSILENDGYLLIFEVVSLLHGEQPYGDTGYILLGEKQIRELFDAPDIKGIYLNNTDKTNMFAIPKAKLINVTAETIYKTLLSLKHDIYESLKKEYNLRKQAALENQQISSTTVKNYGFLSQHYLNCMFAIETLEAKLLIPLKLNLTTDSEVIDDLMFLIDRTKDYDKLHILRNKLLEFTSEKSQRLIRSYLENGSFNQRKSARYYFQNVRKS